MKDLKNRLLEYIKYKRMSIKQFEEKSGLSNGYVSSMRKGFGAQKLENVLRAFPDLNRDWLLYNEGEMIKKPEPPMEDPVQNVSDIISMSREVWDAMSARDRRIDEILDRMKVRDDQVDRLISTIDARDEKIITLIKEQIKKGEDVGDRHHVAPGAVGE